VAEIRGELATGRPARQQTTLEAWLSA
jgi:hypothetical protein